MRLVFGPLQAGVADLKGPARDADVMSPRIPRLWMGSCDTHELSRCLRMAKVVDGASASSLETAFRTALCLGVDMT